MLHFSFFSKRKLKRSGSSVSTRSKRFFPLFFEFSAFTYGYTKKKILAISHGFEKQKNILVRFFMMKRGRYNRAFLHIVAMSVLGVGVMLAPILASTFPIFAQQSQNVSLGDSDTQQSITMDSDVFQTQISQKPREKITMYTVQKGDTVSTIAKKYNISADSVRWANELKNDNITVGDELKIPSVTGILHKVSSGDTVYSIAKKYDTNAQAIVDFPYNDFANPQTFSLVVGEIVMVPDGVKPEEQPTYVRPQRFIAQGRPSAVGSSGYAWPIHGPLSQGYSWYHAALDIESPVGTPVMSAQTGTVSQVFVGGWNGGYGTHVLITGTDGNVTLYAHMSGVNVSVGQAVTAGGTTVGWVGMTGRTTGPHLHFEVKGANPLSYLP
jgi:murein DD-endopeptidase MepM/ murein hydrolase activator NlpD